jgi:hypothetical protein
MDALTNLASANKSRYFAVSNTAAFSEITCHERRRLMQERQAIHTEHGFLLLIELRRINNSDGP